MEYRMSENIPTDITDIIIRINLPDPDAEELSNQATLLRKELLEFKSVQSVDSVSLGIPSEGAKAADLNLIGEWIVKLSVAAIPSLFELLKNHQTKVSTRVPMKIKVRVGRRRAVEVEYDPEDISPQQLEELVSRLSQAIRSK